MFAPRLESVRKHQAGLQSFRSMRRIEASRRNASALRLRFSQSLASLRQRLSQAKVRSTTQRRGSATNPFVRSERLTISGHLEKLLPLAIADSSGVNVNESERERSGIIRGQFYGVWRGGAIFRGALLIVPQEMQLTGKA